jgi:hypothetical protein
VIAGVVFQHRSIESLIRELSRNLSLLEVCGFEVLPLQKKPIAELVRDRHSGQMTVVHPEPGEAYYAVPSGWNPSRFLTNVIELEAGLGLVTGMIGTLREQLMEELPEFGQHLGYDGKAIESQSTGHKNRHSGETSDPDADWGKHETVGIDHRTGKPWIKGWFGYGLHRIADTRYEIPVAVHVTPASSPEQIELRAMIRETFEHSAHPAQRCQDFSAERGLDTGETKALLWDDYRIRPLIDSRELWREEKQQPNYDPTRVASPGCGDYGSRSYTGSRGTPRLRGRHALRGEAPTLQWSEDSHEAHRHQDLRSRSAGDLPSAARGGATGAGPSF